MPDLNAGALDSIDLRSELGRHHSDCMGWALVCCSFDRDEAIDVLQETYLKVLDGRAIYRGESAFRTWLFGVIRRTAGEHRRRLARRFTAPWRREHDQLPDVALDPAGQLDQRAAAERVRKATQSLSLRQRQVLYLVFNNDLSIDAAAAVVGISLGSARTHYTRGKAHLRQLLQVEPS